MSDELASAARLLGEPARAAMLMRLMKGVALPAGELARAANVSPQTASEHLARLTEGSFVTAHRQGRHRYYALASPEVADAVESLLVLTAATPENRPGNRSKPPLGSLAHARTCYSHLAGWLGVAVGDALLRQGYLSPASGRAFLVTESGCAWFRAVGVSVPGSYGTGDAKLARRCQDWTERRPHLGGKLGVSMYRQFVASRWIVPGKSTRTVRVTLEGKQALAKHLQIVVS